MEGFDIIYIAVATLKSEIIVTYRHTCDIKATEGILLTIPGCTEHLISKTSSLVFRLCRELGQSSPVGSISRVIDIEIRVIANLSNIEAK